MNIAKFLLLLVGVILFFAYLEDSRRRDHNETINLIMEEDISEILVNAMLKEKIILTSFKNKRDIAGFLKAVDDIEKFGYGSIGKTEARFVNITIHPLNVHLSCHIRENVAEYLYCKWGGNNSPHGNFRSRKIRDWVESL